MSLISTYGRQTFGRTRDSPPVPAGRLSNDYFSSTLNSSYNVSSPYESSGGAAGQLLRSSSMFNPHQQHTSPSAGALPSAPCAAGDNESHNYFSGWVFKSLSPSSTGEDVANMSNRVLHHIGSTGLGGLNADLYSGAAGGGGGDGGFTNYSGLSAMLYAAAADGAISTGPVRVRVVKRRVSANRKERRRTHSINSAFSALRECIPNVPSDTKLSKIKTLRLATSYIAYLMDVLNKDDPALAQVGAFKAEITKKIESREEKKKRESEVSNLPLYLYNNRVLVC